MRKVIIAVTAILVFTATSLHAQKPKQDQAESFAKLMEDYDEAWLKLNPMRATVRGDNRFNDVLYIDFTDSHRATLQQVYDYFYTALSKFSRETLSDKDKVNYDVLKSDLEVERQGLQFKNYLIPFDQKNGLPIYLALFGSGTGTQPFKTVKDYENWLSRAAVFPAWSDSAIVYFKRGMAEGIVLPKALVEKMMPQLTALITDTAKSTFYGPINKLPVDFSDADRKRLTAAYSKLITEQLNPSYQKLLNFLQTEYLPVARTTSGIGALPEGEKMYAYYIRYYTTTKLGADAVFNLGQSEVARIQKEMIRVKSELGFSGTLEALFDYMKTDPKFYPFKTADEILNAYRYIQKRIDPKLKAMFNHVPKTPFEIRQVEAFRAASTPPQYRYGSLENKRPGIFYVPIVDVAKTSVDESIFLHEAIPGHHYQLSLQRENGAIPKFRRYSGNAAYTEGWGLYTESLGKKLGVYTDPYQYIRALGWEIHRAIRLVVDAGLHSKGWTREQAIKYMMGIEPITEQFAVSEIERYMSQPGQALSYKIGELKLKELRAKYAKQLGAAFNLASFHDAILMDGALPLEVLEQKMEAWANQQKRSF